MGFLIVYRVVCRISAGYMLVVVFLKDLEGVSSTHTSGFELQ